MPRRLQDKIHSEKSTNTQVWTDYGVEIYNLFTGANNKEDFTDHLIREYNRKIYIYGLDTGLFFSPYDAGYRFLSNTAASRGEPIPPTVERAYYTTAGRASILIYTSGTQYFTYEYDNTTGIITGQNNGDGLYYGYLNVLTSPEEEERSISFYASDENKNPFGYIQNIIDQSSAYSIYSDEQLKSIDVSSFTEPFSLSLQRQDAITGISLSNSLRGLYLQNCDFASLDIDLSELTNLEDLDISYNNITGELSISSNSLTNLRCYNNPIESFDLNTPSLQVFSCADTLIDTLDFTSTSTNLTHIHADRNPFLTAINYLDLPTSLESLSVNTCVQLASMNLSDLENLIHVGASQCFSLSSVLASGVALSYNYFSYAGSSFDSCNLDATALNNFFLSLAPADDGVIIVTNNPGSLLCNPGFAPAGYIIITE